MPKNSAAWGDSLIFVHEMEPLLGKIGASNPSNSKSPQGEVSSFLVGPKYVMFGMQC